jgi:hypothetical protein
MRHLLSLFLLTGSLQAAPLWVCDGGQSEINWLPETESVQVRLRSPESLDFVRASTNEKACAKDYYSPTGAMICLKKELSDMVRWQDDGLVIDNLKRWSYGSQLQFLAGQYRPSIEQTEDGWVLHLNNAVMVNSKTLIQWDNGPIALSNCEAVMPYPMTQVRIQILGDQYIQGTLVSAPIPKAAVYAGDWHAGQVLGETDNEGMLTLDMEVGASHISVMKLTSSHSALWSDPQSFNVSKGRDNVFRLHVAPTTVRILSSTPVPYGKAVYITGEGEYLGNWQVATRLNIRPDGRWELLKNLPVGATYKLLVADWTDSSTLWLEGQSISWESGPNHQIPPLKDYYEVVIEASPRFL